MSERDFVRQLESSSLPELTRVLSQPQPEYELVLNVLLGEDRLERLRRLAREGAEAGEAKRGTVFVLGGILGSELWKDLDEIWLDAQHILAGEFEFLHVKDDGSSEQPIIAPHLLLVYVEMLLALQVEWNVVACPFDWRLDIEQSARQLKQVVDANVAAGESLHFVTHSMGGLVVRSMLQQNQADKARLERLVFIAVPNFGTFAIPRLYSRLNPILDMVAVAEASTPAKLLSWMKNWVGTYQMLPFLGHNNDAARLSAPAAYGPLNPPQPRFDDAHAFQQRVEDDLASLVALPAGTLTQIAGYGYETACGVVAWDKLDQEEGYEHTRKGDGNIAHTLGIIPAVTTYFSNHRHEWLPAEPEVVLAVADILKTGTTNRLPQRLPFTLGIFTEAELLVIAKAEARLAQAQFTALRDSVIAQQKMDLGRFTLEESCLQHLLYSGHSSALKFFPQLARAMGAG